MHFGQSTTMRHVIPFRDEHGKVLDASWEAAEYADAKEHIPRSATVLEVGGRYGVASAGIQEALDDGTRHVVVEPDPLVWQALEHNKAAHGHEYIIVKEALGVEGYTVNQQGAGTFLSGGVKGGASLAAVRKATNLEFDTLVIDCEGCVFQLYRDEPTLFDGIQRVLIEKDGGRRYAEYDALLVARGYTEVKPGFHSVWVKSK